MLQQVLLCVYQAVGGPQPHGATHHLALHAKCWGLESSSRPVSFQKRHLAISPGSNSACVFCKLVALRLLGFALHQLACQHLLGATNDMLTGRRAAVQCVDQLELVFSDADQVAQANLMSSVTQVSAPPPGAATQSAQASNVAVSMFDDDLDLGASSTAAGPNR